MRTRRADAGTSSTTQSGTAPSTTRSATRAVAGSAVTQKTRTAPKDASPGRARSRPVTTPGRTPLAVKNAHSSSSQPSSFGVEAGNAINAGLDNKTSAQRQPDQAQPKKPPPRRSLAERLEEALGPVDEEPNTHHAHPASSKSGQVTSSKKSKVTAASSAAGASASRRAERRTVKKTVTASGFYAQAAPAVPPPRQPSRPTIVNKAKSKPLTVASDTENTPPAVRVSTSTRAAKVSAPNLAQTVRKPLQPLAPADVPTQQSTVVHNLARGGRTGPSSGTARSALDARRPGMVVWDDDEDEEDGKGKDGETTDDESADHDEHDKLATPSDRGSSDKENRNPLADRNQSRSGASQTIIPANRYDSQTGSVSGPVSVVTTPPRSALSALTSAERAPLEVLADVGPSHSTPVAARSGRSGQGKSTSKSQQDAVVSAAAVYSASSGSSESFAISPAPELSSSIPASDDVYAFTGKGDLLPMAQVSQAEPQVILPATASSTVEQADVPSAALTGAEGLDDYADLDLGIDVPDVDADAEALANPRQVDVQSTADEENVFATASNVGHGEPYDEMAHQSISYDPIEDPYGFFAAEAKLRALRHKSPPPRDEGLDAGQVEEPDEVSARRDADLYGLDLRTKAQPFAASEPASSDSESEEAAERSAKDLQADQKALAQEEPDETSDQSLVRRSTRTKKRKAPVVELSDTESEPAQAADARDASQDSDVRRSGPLYDKDAPFDSDDERAAPPSSKPSTAARRTKKKSEKELSLTDLVKMLPKRAPGVTYGKASKGKGKDKGPARSVSASRGRTQREEASSPLPSPRRVARSSKKATTTTGKRRARDEHDADSDEEEEEKDDHPFSEVSEDEGPTSKKKAGKHTTGGRPTKKTRTDTLSAAQRLRADVESRQAARAPSGSSRKRARRGDDDGDDGDHASEGDEPDSTPPRKRVASGEKRGQTKTEKKGRAKTARSAEAPGSSAAASTATSKKGKKAKRSSSSTSSPVARRHDELDDFELDEEIVI